MNELLEVKEMKSTMTVYEIAKICKYTLPHKNAMKICETLMLDESFKVAESATSLESVVYGANGQTLQSYALNKRQSFALASRLNVTYLMSVIDRWQELENPKPLTRIELLERMLDVERANERLRLEVIEAEAKAIRRLSKIGDHLAGSVISEIENNVTFNNVAKILSSNLCIKLGHNKLMALCRDNGWLMTGERSKSEKNMPFQNKMDYFKIKLFHNPDTNVVSVTPVLTPKGVVKLSKLVPIWFTE